MYGKVVMDRFQNPRNAGGLYGANAIGQVGGIGNSEIMKLYLKISNEGTIENAQFKTSGCALSIASLDVACDLMKGKDIENALKISSKDITKVLGEVPEHRKMCLTLTEEVIRTAIQDYFSRQEKETKKAIKNSKK